MLSHSVSGTSFPISPGADSTANYAAGETMGKDAGLSPGSNSSALGKGLSEPLQLTRLQKQVKVDSADSIFPDASIQRGSAHRRGHQRSNPLHTDLIEQPDDPLTRNSDREPATTKRSPKRGRANQINNVGTDPLTGVVQENALVAAEPSDAGPLDPTPRQRAAGLPYPGRMLKYVPGAPLKFDAAAKQWQERMKERGWSIQVDGFYGAQSEKTCRQFQRAKKLSVDGIVGPATWAATFKADVVTTPSPSGASDLGRINQKGLDLVKKFEGLVLRAYRDPVGIWTIGYGHTGPEVGPGDVISKAEAEALLKKDLMKFEKSVRNLVKVPLNSNQFSALVSFTFNVGSGAFAQSTMLSLLNQRDYQGAANQFSRWVYGGGQVLPGLVRRRNEERALFLTKV